MKKTTRFYRIYGPVFLAILLAGGIAHLAVPDRAYSNSEKRALSAAPAFNADSVFSGDFMAHAEDYCSDQFPLRETWMQIRMNALYTIGVRESQGVYFNTDGTLVEPFPAYSEERLQETTAALNGFLEKHGFEHAYFLLVPTASEIRSDVLPPHAENASEREYFEAFIAALSEKATVFDVYETLKTFDVSDDAYYGTDHHWTTDGAYAVFQSLLEKTGWAAGNWSFETVSNRFLGSLAAKSGFTPAKTDRIRIAVSRNEDLYTLVDHGENGGVAGSFYDFDAFRAGMDEYTIFLGGNDPEITVRTTADTERTLLVFKDSYANCFLPFLAESYKEITIVDPRYFSENAETLFLNKQYTDFLCLYNLQTLSQDGNLNMILSEP